MSEHKYEICDTCKKWGWTNTHKCPPKWEYYFHGEKWGDVYARDAEDAACQAVAWCLSDLEYPENVDVEVVNTHGQRYNFEIEVRSEPVFYATEKGNAKEALKESK